MENAEITLGTRKARRIGSATVEELIRSESWDQSWITQPEAHDLKSSLKTDATTDFPSPLLTNSAYIIGTSQQGLPIALIVHGIAAVHNLSWYIRGGIAGSESFGSAYQGKPCVFDMSSADFQRLEQGDILPLLRPDDLDRSSASRYVVVLDRSEAIRSQNDRRYSLQNQNSKNILLRCEAGGKKRLEALFNDPYETYSVTPFATSLFSDHDYSRPRGMLVELEGLGMQYRPAVFDRKSRMLKSRKE